jgi:methionyl aminopeptidase
VRDPGEVSTAPVQQLRANDPCWCGSGRKYKRCHKGTGGPLSEPITPGVQSPTRTVPPEIVRPDYIPSGIPTSRRPSKATTPEQVERMRRAGRAAAEILQVTGAAVRPGITTDELDAI